LKTKPYKQEQSCSGTLIDETEEQEDITSEMYLMGTCPDDDDWMSISIYGDEETVIPNDGFGYKSEENQDDTRNTQAWVAGRRA
jgi:hypothetical protein